MTKIAGNLPKGDGNGLDAIAALLIDNPKRIQVIVALVDCKKTTTDNDTGDVEPTARIRRIEAITGDDKPLAARMLTRALELRNGRTVLPFDLEVDMRSAFGRIDPQTGEILGDDE